MTKVKYVNKIIERGYPTSSRFYDTAHAEADKAEKKRFPSGYEVLKKEVAKNARKKVKEDAATNTKSGKIEIEKKYKKYTKELVFHEKKEHENLKRLEKNKKSVKK